MKNLFVGSTKAKQQPNGYQSDQVMNTTSGNTVKAVFQHTGRAIGRRVEMTTKDRPRGKSCDRMVTQGNRNHYNNNNEWNNDDGGFGQWRSAIHHYGTTSRPEVSFHHARPISVSITDRIQLVLQQEDKQHITEQPSPHRQQHDSKNGNHEDRDISHHGRFLRPFPAASSSYYYPEYHPHSASSVANNSDCWPYQSGISSSEEAPKSLDSQWALVDRHQQQQSYVVRFNHPAHPDGGASSQQAMAASLSRKLSTYGTLPRHRQRFFMAKYQSKIPVPTYASLFCLIFNQSKVGFHQTALNTVMFY